MKLTDVELQFYKELRKGEIMDKITTQRQPEDYSLELRDLVHDCLRFIPIQRPNIWKLLKRVREGREKFRDRWLNGEPVQESARLVIGNDELNQMEPGAWTNEYPDKRGYYGSILSDPVGSLHGTGDVPFNYPPKSPQSIPLSEYH